MGGWRYIVGYPDRAPARVGVSIGDTLAATYGCMGALAALHHRERTGEGQIIDSSLYEAVLQVMESLLPEYAIGGYTRERTGSVLPNVAPSNVYRCSDGEYLIGANQDAIFRRLCIAMGDEALADDPRYATHIARGQHQEELDTLIEGWTSRHTVAEVEAAMLEHAVPAGRIFKAVDMLDDPHFADRRSIIEVDHPQWGRFPMQNAFPRFSAADTGFRTFAPSSVGEDTADILHETLGLSAEAIDALRAKGIV